MWLLAVTLIILLSVPDKAQGSPYQVRLTLDENVVKIEKQKVKIKFTKNESILKGDYNVPTITPERPKPTPKVVRVVVQRSSISNSGYNSNSVINYVRLKNKQMFGEQHWNALYQLVSRESGWQLGRTNNSSYACGLGQSLPCSKTYGYTPQFVMRNGKMFVANPSLSKETTFLLNYIAGRYGNPTNANAFQARMNWY